MRKLFGSVMLIVGAVLIWAALPFRESTLLVILIGAALAVFGLAKLLPDTPQASAKTGNTQGRAGRIRYTREVAGESQYQAALERIAGPRGEEGCNFECMALLMPEPHNQHDPNAVSVWIERQKVGYLPRADALAWTAKLAEEGEASKAVEVPAKIVGGWYVDSDDQGAFGVKLSY